MFRWTPSHLYPSPQKRVILLRWLRLRLYWRSCPCLWYALSYSNAYYCTFFIVCFSKLVLKLIIHIIFLCSSQLRCPDPNLRRQTLALLGRLYSMLPMRSRLFCYQRQLQTLQHPKLIAWNLAQWKTDLLRWSSSNYNILRGDDVDLELAESVWTVLKIGLYVPNASDAVMEQV